MVHKLSHGGYSRYNMLTTYGLSWFLVEAVRLLAFVKGQNGNRVSFTVSRCFVLQKSGGRVEGLTSHSTSFKITKATTSKTKKSGVSQKKSEPTGKCVLKRGV